LEHYKKSCDLEIRKKFYETIYARMAELVLGSTPAATRALRVHARHRPQQRQLAATHQPP
jgi:hypothetical protein